MPDAAYRYDGEAQDAALVLLEGHPDVLSYRRVFAASPVAAERYEVVFLDGKRFSVEISYEGQREAA